MADRHHVAVAVVVLLEELRIAAIGTEAGGTVVEINVRHAGVVSLDSSVVLGVACAKFVHHRTGEGMDVAKLPIGEKAAARVGETTRASSVTGAKLVRRVKPVELCKGPIVGVPVIV